jgi:hypothetical protein
MAIRALYAGQKLIRNRHWQSPGRYHQKLPNSPGEECATPAQSPPRGGGGYALALAFPLDHLLRAPPPTARALHAVAQLGCTCTKRANTQLAGYERRPSPILTP